MLPALAKIWADLQDDPINPCHFHATRASRLQKPASRPSVIGPFLVVSFRISSPWPPSNLQMDAFVVTLGPVMARWWSQTVPHPSYRESTVVESSSRVTTSPPSWFVLPRPAPEGLDSPVGDLSGWAQGSLPCDREPNQEPTK